MADPDLDGDGVAEGVAALTAAGISEGERRRLAEQYTAPTTLWRAELTHFSAWDCNWPFGPPAILGTADQGILLWDLENHRVRLVDATSAETQAKRFCAANATEDDQQHGRRRACETAAADLVVHLARHDGTGCRPTLTDHALVTRRVADGVEVELAPRTCRTGGVVTYFLRAPYLKPAWRR